MTLYDLNRLLSKITKAHHKQLGNITALKDGFIDVTLNSNLPDNKTEILRIYPYQNLVYIVNQSGVPVYQMQYMSDDLPVRIPIGYSDRNTSI